MKAVKYALVILALCASLTWSDTASVSQNIGSLKNQIQSLVTKLTNSVGSIACETVRDALGSAANTLNVLDTILGNLDTYVSSLSKHLGLVVGRQKRAIAQETDDWVTAQITKVSTRTNGQGLQQALPILAEYRNKQSSNLDNCLNEQVNAILQRVQELVSVLVEAVTNLSSLSDSCSTDCAADSCTSNLNSVLQTVIAGPNGVNQILLEIQTLVSAGLTNGCVQKDLADRDAVEQRLNAIN